MFRTGRNVLRDGLGPMVLNSLTRNVTNFRRILRILCWCRTIRKVTLLKRPIKSSLSSIVSTKTDINVPSFRPLCGWTFPSGHLLSCSGMLKKTRNTAGNLKKRHRLEGGTPTYLTVTDINVPERSDAPFLSRVTPSGVQACFVTILCAHPIFVRT